MRRIAATTAHYIEKRVIRLAALAVRARIQRPIHLFFGAVSHIDDAFALVCREFLPQEAIVSGSSLSALPVTRPLFFKTTEEKGVTEKVSEEASSLYDEFKREHEVGKDKFFSRLVGQKKTKLLVSALSGKEIHDLFYKFYKKNKNAIAALFYACSLEQRAVLLNDLDPNGLAYFFIVLKGYSFSYLLQEVKLEEQDKAKVREALEKIKADSSEDYKIVLSELEGIWDI